MENKARKNHVGNKKKDTLNIRTKLGVKSSTNHRQLTDRISRKDVDIFEFHLLEDDLFGEKRQELEYWIQFLRDQNINVYLHHPPYINGSLMHINATDSIVSSFYELSTRILVELCEEYDCHTVIHWDFGKMDEFGNPTNGAPASYSQSELEHILKRTLIINETIGKGRILWENSTVGIGAYRSDYLWAELIAETDIKLTFDVSHAFISLKGDNDALEKTMLILNGNINYLHVVDSMGIAHDSLPIGEGKVDFKRLKPFIITHNYIYEVGLSDINHCKEMVESHRFFSAL